jgi:hypothetical protein
VIALRRVLKYTVIIAALLLASFIEPYWLKTKTYISPYMAEAGIRPIDNRAYGAIARLEVDEMPVNMEDGLVVSLINRIKEIAAGQVLWPGFDPTGIPLAFYNGKNTFLFGHPAPPGEFIQMQMEGAPVWFFPGRHRTIVANTHIELAGELVATIMLDPTLNSPENSPELNTLAGVAIHEMFHVYQSRHQSAWPFANEADSFLYPVTDAEIIALRRQEIEALRRALESDTPDQIAGWAKRAMKARRERFGKMDGVFAEYERRIEKIEGLACYVEALVVKQSVASRLDYRQAAEIRYSCYGTGSALAALLDRVAPGWKDGFENRLRALDEVLREVLGDLVHTGGCDFSPDETEHFSEWAREDVRRRLEERLSREKAFAGRPGRRLIIESAEHMPLRVVAMDPLNIHLVHRESGVLHTRLLHLHAGESRIEMLREGDAVIEGLTEGVGPHPLFSGVKRVEFVVGEGDLRVNESQDMLKIVGKGINAELRARQWMAQGDTLRVFLKD